MYSGDFARPVETIGSLSVRRIQDLQHVIASLSLRMEASWQVERRQKAEPVCHGRERARLERWGRSRTGFQRWRCAACGTTRSTTTGAAVAAIRLPQARRALIKKMFSGVPSSSCRTGVERPGRKKMTFCRWRRLVLAALSDIGATELQGIIDEDETFPDLRICPMTHPRPALNVVRGVVLERQRQVGFRECEVH